MNVAKYANSPAAVLAELRATNAEFAKYLARTANRVPTKNNNQKKIVMKQTIPVIDYGKYYRSLENSLSVLNGDEPLTTSHLPAAEKSPKRKLHEELSIGSPPEIEHEHEPVPDPAETESAIPSKESVPSYDDFTERMAALTVAIGGIYSEEATHDDKVQSMKTAISALNDLSSWLKKI
jgi:hypothetical protein